MRLTIITSILTFLCIVIVLALIRYYSDRESRKIDDEKGFSIYFPKLIFIIGVVEIIFCIAIEIGILLTEKSKITILLCSIGIFMAMLVGTFLIVKTLTHKIVVKGKEITVFSAFRKPYSFSFDDIVCAKRKIVGRTEQVVIKTSFGKKFAVENMEISYDIFIKALKNKVNRQYLIGF